MKSSLLFFSFLSIKKGEGKRKKFPPKLSSSLRNEETSIKEEEGKPADLPKKRKKKGEKKDQERKVEKGKRFYFHPND